MLAIIIPYYRLKYFEETLLSLESQTNKNFLLYIGNDASPENPERNIDKILRTVNFKYFYYSDNFGSINLARQWERIIADISAEEWFMLLGDDDFLSHNVVEEFYKMLPEVEKEGLSHIKIKKNIVDAGGNVVQEEKNLPKIYSSVRLLEDKLNGRIHNSLSENIFKKETALKYGFQHFPLAWHSDDLALLEFAETKNFMFLENAIVYVRISAESISGQDNRDPRKNLAAHMFYEYLLKNYNHLFSKDLTRLIVKRYREVSWKGNLPMNFNITKAFLSQNDYLMALKSVKMKNDHYKKLKNSK